MGFSRGSLERMDSLTCSMVSFGNPIAHRNSSKSMERSMRCSVHPTGVRGRSIAGFPLFLWPS